VGRVPDDDPDFTHQAHLFRSGYLDSVGVVQLIDYIEVDLKLELNDEELSDPDFVTIDGISAIVSTRIRDRAADDSRRST
jgi:acyl carrier protein